MTHARHVLTFVIGLCAVMPVHVHAQVSGRVPANMPSAPNMPSGASLDAEVASLRADMSRELGGRYLRNAADDAGWIARARAQVQSAGKPVSMPGLMVVVDRNPAVQQAVVILARQDAQWQVIGGSRVSTGQANRKGYFITPVGVFINTSDILGYRAQGTYNENHIRGLGVKGMRVWDFGWQDAMRGWGNNGRHGDIRLSMHATDPAVLEARLGRPASEGCVRLPAQMNVFLDKHGVIDAEDEAAAQYDRRFAALLRADRTPSPLAGNALVVVDSSAVSR